MKFDDLEAKMRVFETAHDHSVLPGLFMVVRLDGRSFTRLTKELHDFEAPFDDRVRDHMVSTTAHLMGCGFRVAYGYTQSDEISLLFHLRETSFDRQLRKYTSILASEAGAHFSLRLGSAAVFDARVCQLPAAPDVVDYFRWRQEDATRNALSAHCYWLLRKRGRSVKEASSRLRGLDASAKSELLAEHGVSFARLPVWQKRGIGLYWETHTKTGFNPRSGTAVKANRRRIRIELDLPVKEAYQEFLRHRIGDAVA